MDEPVFEPERRQTKRHNVEALVCRFRSIDEEESVCVLRNVSMEGLFVLSRNIPPIGTAVHLEFSRYPLEGYSLTGRVVRYGFGLRGGFAVRFPGPHPRLLKAAFHREHY